MIYSLSSEIAESSLAVDADAIVYDDVSGDTHLLPPPISTLLLQLQQALKHTDNPTGSFEFRPADLVSEQLCKEEISLACEQLESLGILTTIKKN